jgi:excisionase family DNA binding protein
MSFQKLADVKTTAEMLAISPKTVWAMVAAQKIDVVRIGRSVRIPLNSIEKIIEEGMTPARVA